MNQTDKEHLHKLYAGFAMIGLIMRGKSIDVARESFSIADAMVEEIDARENKGIASVISKYKRKETLNESNS